MSTTKAAALFGMLVLVVATTCVPAWAQKPIRIGFMAPLTGGAAQVGKDMVDGFNRRVRSWHSSMAHELGAIATMEQDSTWRFAYWKRSGAMHPVRAVIVPAVFSRSRLLIALSALALAACAPEIVRRPTQLTPVTNQPGSTIEILEDASIAVGPGYRRVIGRGTVWTRIGRSAEGEIFKPVDRVFTVEGAHIHEAYLVLAGDRVVGFYLPVERAFSPAPGGETTRLSIRRRQP